MIISDFMLFGSFSKYLNKLFGTLFESKERSSKDTDKLLHCIKSDKSVRTLCNLQLEIYLKGKIDF